MVDGLRHHFKCVRKQRQGSLAGVGEQDLTARAAEERSAGKLFKLADLLADRAGRDIQFLGGAGEGQVPSGRLESPEGVERWQAFVLSHDLKDFLVSGAGKGA